jgi:hypothetical protein
VDEGGRLNGASLPELGSDDAMAPPWELAIVGGAMHRTVLVTTVPTTWTLNGTSRTTPYLVSVRVDHKPTSGAIHFVNRRLIDSVFHGRHVSDRLMSPKVK